MFLFPPTLWNTWVSIALSTFACVCNVMSPISSRNIVPLSASSNLPLFLSVAPVKAPFSWPNNSLSINSWGIAAQLTSTKGPSARRLFSCKILAAISLPVPLSPRSSTLLLLWAAIAICCLRACILAESPINLHFFLRSALSVRFSSSSFFRSSALFVTISTFSSDRGFSRKSYAPSFVALTASSMFPCPEIIITGMSLSISLNFDSVSMPSISGSQTSRSIRSGICSLASSSASSPVGAVMTVYFSSSNMPDRLSLMPASSSTIRTVPLDIVTLL